MQTEITELKSPIDAMYLIHKALRGEAHRAEQEVQRLEVGSSLQRFELGFYSWATALVYHAEAEDRHITPYIAGTDARHSQNGRSPQEAGAERTAAPQTTRARNMGAAMGALEERLHVELVEKMEEVLAVLNDEIGRTSVIQRTKQHLRGQVLDLRLAQEDHLEIEEALILPLVRERMSEDEQLATVKSLLIDEDAEDPRWIIDWLVPHLSSGEQSLLKDLEARLAVPRVEAN